MSGPEEPIRALTEAEAAELLRARFPELAGLAVVRLGEGTDHQAFEVGGRYVFRFPRGSEAADALLAEARLTAWLAPRLPLAIPSYRFLAEAGGGSARAFGGYEKLAGTPALLVNPDRVDAAAAGRRVGELLRRLHEVDVAAAEALGLPQDDDPELAEWSAGALADLHLARERGHVGAREEAAWERALARPPRAAGRPGRVVHGDLAAEHVLLGGDGVPSGVIDWSDAVAGDPARDLAGLVHWGGERMLASALERYGDVEDTTLRRARWLAACRAFADLAFGESRRRPEYVRAGLRALGWLDPRRGLDR